ncbi:MAG: energy-coupling factor ABC transporter permease [candidate division WOR-3 bacterium]
MHMADALISPAVGGTMWAASTGLAAYSARKLRSEIPEGKIPLMAVSGAFVFAAQMINFSIPGTGSSGHLGGGLILAVLLGPHAAFLVMFSVLAVQALFFGDGGLLALGCNVFNLGFWTCFVAYPLLFRRVVGDKPAGARLTVAALLAAVLGLQLGAFSVVLETLLSGITELPFGKFVLLMQPIHLAIGIVEGIVTAALVAFVWRARPEVLGFTAGTGVRLGVKPVLVTLGIAAVVVGGLLSRFASSHPDGLEWSIFRAAGTEELEARSAVHQSLAEVQKRTAFLPDYGFAEPEAEPESGMTQTDSPAKAEEKSKPWPAVSAGTSVAGLVGSALVLGLAGLVGLAVNVGRRRKS